MTAMNQAVRLHISYGFVESVEMLEESHSLGLSQQVPDSTFSNVCDLSVTVTSNCAWPNISRSLYLVWQPEKPTAEIQQNPGNAKVGR